MMVRSSTATCLALALSACSSDGSVGLRDSGELADVTGTYTVSGTYGENGCQFEDWPQDDSVMNISFVVEQDGAELTGRVEGITGGILALIHGSNEYAGTLQGKHGSLVIFGTRSLSEGNCTFTYNNYIEVDFNGDFISGQLAFTAAVTDNPDCDTVACSSLMSINGTRPPP